MGNDYLFMGLCLKLRVVWIWRYTNAWHWCVLRPNLCAVDRCYAAVSNNHVIHKCFSVKTPNVELRGWPNGERKWNRDCTISTARE